MASYWFHVHSLIFKVFYYFHLIFIEALLNLPYFDIKKGFAETDHALKCSN